MKPNLRTNRNMTHFNGNDLRHLRVRQLLQSSSHLTLNIKEDRLIRPNNLTRRVVSITLTRATRRTVSPRSHFCRYYPLRAMSTNAPIGLRGSDPLFSSFY